MSQIPRFFVGTRRPHWAGPVTIHERPQPPRRSRAVRALEVSDLVLPLQASAHPLTRGADPHSGGHRARLSRPHTHLLKHPARSGRWSAIARAAAELMGWHAPRRPVHAAAGGAPPAALRLRLSALLPAEGEDNGLDPDTHLLTSELQKVVPVRDPLGRHLHMRDAGSPARLHVGASSAGFSRDPRLL